MGSCITRIVNWAACVADVPTVVAAGAAVGSGDVDAPYSAVQKNYQTDRKASDNFDPRPSSSKRHTSKWRADILPH
eukprot:gene17170-12284_t